MLIPTDVDFVYFVAKDSNWADKSGKKFTFRVEVEPFWEDKESGMMLDVKAVNNMFNHNGKIKLER